MHMEKKRTYVALKRLATEEKQPKSTEIKLDVENMR